MFNPNEIFEKKFEKAAFGYKPEAVDEFLAEVSEAYSKLLWEKKELDKKIQVLAEKVQEYRETEESLKETLLTAQRLGDSLVKDSKIKAETLLSDATNKAEVILKDAEIKAEKIIETAERRLIGEQQAFVTMQREVSDFKTRLMSLYKTHIEIISSLPEYQEYEEELEEKDPLIAEVIEDEEETTVEADSDVADDELTLDFTPKDNSEEEKVSRFGELKFGDDYDIKGDTMRSKSDKR